MALHRMMVDGVSVSVCCRVWIWSCMLLCIVYV